MTVRQAALLVSGALVMWASTALAYCPTQDTARKGFVLVAPEDRARIEVKPSTDDIVSLDLFVGGQLMTSPTYYRGLYLIRVVAGHDTTSAAYDFDYLKEPEPTVGYHKMYHITLTQPDGKATTDTIDSRIVSREALTVGDCTLDTLVFESQVAFPDRPMQTRHTHYSPLLRTFVRESIANDGSPPTWLIYDHIEPLSR